MEAPVSYLLMLQKYINSKQKIQNWNHIFFALVILQNILQLVIWKKTRLKGSVKIFSVDYNTLDIHRCLIKKA